MRRGRAAPNGGTDRPIAVLPRVQASCTLGSLRVRAPAGTPARRAAALAVESSAPRSVRARPHRPHRRIRRRTARLGRRQRPAARCWRRRSSWRCVRVSARGPRRAPKELACRPSSSAFGRAAVPREPSSPSPLRSSVRRTTRSGWVRPFAAPEANASRSPQPNQRARSCADRNASATQSPSRKSMRMLQLLPGVRRSRRPPGGTVCVRRASTACGSGGCLPCSAALLASACRCRSILVKDHRQGRSRIPCRPGWPGPEARCALRQLAQPAYRCEVATARRTTRRAR